MIFDLDPLVEKWFPRACRFITPADISRSVRVGRLAASVCLFVCPEHYSKTNDPEVFKLCVGNNLWISRSDFRVERSKDVKVTGSISAFFTLVRSMTKTNDPKVLKLYWYRSGMALRFPTDFGIERPKVRVNSNTTWVRTL